MTPYEIKILLWINSSPSWRDQVGVDMTTDLWHSTMEKFRESELIGPDDQPSQKLRIYCDALCSVPMPVLQYVMPHPYTPGL